MIRELERRRESRAAAVHKIAMLVAEELRTRGGGWFESGTVQIHLGIEENFRPAKKAHPALNSSDYGALIARLRAAGVEAREVRDVSGVRRCHIHDPFGNRIELIDGNPRANAAR